MAVIDSSIFDLYCLNEKLFSGNISFPLCCNVINLAIRNPLNFSINICKTGRFNRPWEKRHYFLEGLFLLIYMKPLWISFFNITNKGRIFDSQKEINTGLIKKDHDVTHAAVY